MSKLSCKALIATTLLAAVAGSAHAVLLNPGDTQPLPGTTVAAEPQLAGVIEVDELLPFSFADGGGNISGTVQVRVVRSSVDNTIDFYWRIFNDANSSDGINLLHVGNFNTSAYDVNWRIDGLGDVGPTEGLRHISPIDNGSIISLLTFSNPARHRTSSLLTPTLSVTHEPRPFICSTSIESALP